MSDPSTPATAAERLLSRWIGLDVSTVGPAAVDRAVRTRMAAIGETDAAAYAARAAADETERDALVEEVVVAESWFFRDPQVFEFIARRAAVLAALPGVHAITDVTGFGLLGHLLEVCRGSGAGATVCWDSVPRLPGVLDLAAAGFVTGASRRNWASFDTEVALPGLGDAERWLLADPQTSGGLLVTCAPGAVDAVLEVFRKEGFDQAAVIGEITAGPPRVSVVRGQ
jgi:hydrogenase maturation factor